MRANSTPIEASEKQVVSFSYAPGSSARAVAEDLIFPECGAAGSFITQLPVATDPAMPHADFDIRLAEETARSFAEGRARGIEEGRIAEREAHRAANSAETSVRAAELASLVQQFSAERDRYLERVETEVVRLALAIAARILRREAQTDPLLLLGAVRVALGQLAGATRIRLRVPAAHASLWTDAVALLPSRAPRPEIVSDDSMRLGECVLESELGSVDLAVPAQLAEIERRLFAGMSTPDAEPVAELAV